METETLDKLFLELSQVTKAKTAREIKLEQALADANYMCRSAIMIAERNGEANWPAFTARLRKSLLRQHAVMYGDQDASDLAGYIKLHPDAEWPLPPQNAESIRAEIKSMKTTQSLSASDATSCYASSILRLTLKRQWFDMIVGGKKMEEYRDPSLWIYARLLEKDGYTHRKYDRIEFKNGYGPNVPTMIVEFKGWKHGIGMPKWGAKPGMRYVVILLGRVISLQNS